MAPQEPHGGLTVRARLAVAVLAALCACGGSPKHTETAPEPPPSAKQRACNRYGIRMAPFMQRFEAALDSYAAASESATDDTARADAARALAAFIDTEIPGLQNIDSIDPELNASHVELVASLEEAGHGLEQLATAYVLDDANVRMSARARRDEGLGRWSEASRAIVAQCNE